MEYPPNGHVTNRELCHQLARSDSWVSINMLQDALAQVFLDPQQYVLMFPCLKVDDTLQQRFDGLAAFGLGT
jgi:hypothetical protein